MAWEFSKLSTVRTCSAMIKNTNASLLDKTSFSAFETTRRALSLTAVQREKTHYEVLGVKPQASKAEIKAAYFKLSKQYHPDVNPDNKAIDIFSAVTLAYEILGNDKKRRMYDSKKFRTVTQKGSPEIIMEMYSAEPTKTSYGSHMRHPEHIQSANYVPNPDVTNFYSYDQFHQRNYHLFIKDNAASLHKKTDLKYMRGTTARGSRDQAIALYFILFGCIITGALCCRLFTHLHESTEKSKEKLRQQHRVGESRGK